MWARLMEAQADPIVEYRVLGVTNGVEAVLPSSACGCVHGLLCGRAGQQQQTSVALHQHWWYTYGVGLGRSAWKH